MRFEVGSNEYFCIGPDPWIDTEAIGNDPEDLKFHMAEKLRGSIIHAGYKTTEGYWLFQPHPDQCYSRQELLDIAHKIFELNTSGGKP